jgi:general secretion pathway protein L
VLSFDDHDQLILLRLRKGREGPASEFAPDEDGRRRLAQRIARLGGPVMLRLDDATIIEREVVLPLAAEADIAGVLRMDMDRLAPFAADEIHWSHSLVTRDVARSQLRVRLSWLPRAASDSALAALRRIGVAPSAILARGLDGDWRHLGLEGPGRQGRRFDRIALRVAAACCGVLALIAAGVPFVRQELHLRQLDTEIAALRPRVAEAEAARREFFAARATDQVVARLGAGVTSPLPVIAAVTAALPDDSHLTEFALRARVVDLRGQSANAARLIGLLSDEPMLQSVAFSAPVTRADTDAVDLFALRAELRP